jgi:hypothetical protein
MAPGLSPPRSGITGTTRNATNPHNQIMTIGIQLGLIGVAILIAMWGAHVRMFCATGLINWIGLVVVAENIIASMFNSQLSDFTTGWIYVFGVGVTCGMLTKAGLIPYTVANCNLLDTLSINPST